MEKLLTIIIPARSEEASIIGTLEGLERSVKTPHTIVVVNDKIASKDRTAQIVQRFSKNHPWVTVAVLHRIGNSSPGFSAAIAEGLHRARTPYVVIVMADSCDDPRDIDWMMGTIEKNGGYDMVCGCRYMAGGRKIGGPFLQGICSKAVNAILRLVVGLPTRDASNSFKLYKRKILQRLPLDRKMGVEASLSLCLHAYFFGARMSDIPTVWRGRKAGVSTFTITHRSLPYARLVLWAVQKKLETFFSR